MGTAMATIMIQAAEPATARNRIAATRVTLHRVAATGVPPHPRQAKTIGKRPPRRNGHCRHRLASAGVGAAARVTAAAAEVAKVVERAGSRLNSRFPKALVPTCRLVQDALLLRVGLHLLPRLTSRIGFMHTTNLRGKMGPPHRILGGQHWAKTRAAEECRLRPMAASLRRHSFPWQRAWTCPRARSYCVSEGRLPHIVASAAHAVPREVASASTEQH
mmetsp:Transcript_30588/g.76966  ORF Transcript_30588/g.76966 Transcript_30588/m.76966 type:complete len:218 (-) Transcript_30588:8-661(-)